MGFALNLVAQLRRRIRDERASRVAFRLLCVDEAASDCTVALTDDGLLTTQVFNGRKAKSLSVDLTDPAFKTVKQLIEFLQLQPGYKTITEQDYFANQVSEDLQLTGSISIRNDACQFRHHIFSDVELLEVLDNACKRHNVDYVPETVPVNEQVFVLMLAHAEVSRQLATDSARRRGLDTTTEQFLTIAADLEDAYAKDVRRQMRAMPVPKGNEQEIEQGDIVVGTVSRRSMRSGFFAPMSNSGVAQQVVLESPSPDDIEDTKVILRWKRNTDLRFYAAELWRDTIPNVERPDDLSKASTNPTLLRLSVKRPFTSKLVFRSFSAHSNKDNVGWATFIESAGQLVTTFVDVGTGDQAPNAGSLVGATTVFAPPLEPSTTYYYRLFVISLNYEVTSSGVVSATTKPLRMLFRANEPVITPKTGPSGTLVTAYGTRFATGAVLTLGGKPVDNLTIVNSTTLTFNVPTYNNPGMPGTLLDLALTSPVTGLRDVYSSGFQLTS